MRLISIILSDHQGIRREEQLGLRLAAIILKLLDERKYIEQWRKGRAEIHWSDDRISLRYLTKVAEN